MPHSAAVPPSRPTRRRAGAVKMQPPTGGTILTAPSTGTSLKSEGRRHHTHIQLKINNHTYTGNLTTSFGDLGVAGDPAVMRPIQPDDLGQQMRIRGIGLRP
jgi:hypothetical protein